MITNFKCLTGLKIWSFLRNCRFYWHLILVTYLPVFTGEIRWCLQVRWCCSQE